MKPAPFKYVEVADEEQLVGALAEYGDDARLLAGGQSLVPMMNFRVVSPAVLIDLNRIEPLSYINIGEETLRIGPLTRHAMLEDSAALTRRCPLLTQAVRNVAHRAVRNRGTTGGTLALAYPGAEIPLAFATLSGDVLVRSRRGRRRMQVQEFIVGALDTALAADEYIESTEIRLPPADTTASFVETSRRHGDFAIAAAAVVAGRDSKGRLNYLRAGLSGGTGAPIRLPELEKIVVAADGEDRTIADACREAVGGIEVFGDHHYPEDYRRHVLAGVLARALRDALTGPGPRHVA